MLKDKTTNEEIKNGSILTKVKDTGGFRKIGSKIEILEVGKDIISVLHLPKNPTAILGNDVAFYGRNFIESNYN